MKVSTINILGFKGSYKVDKKDNNPNSSRCHCNCSGNDSFTRSNCCRCCEHNKGIYFHPSEDTDRKTLLNAFEKRTRRLPLSMTYPRAYIQGYMAGKCSANQFVNGYLGKVRELYQRISLGKNSEEFKENYAPEITMIKKVTDACSKYCTASYEPPTGREGEDLNSTIENAVIDYLDTPSAEKRHFTF